MNEARITAMVQWRMENTRRMHGGQPALPDTDGAMWRLITEATPEELFEAMRRVKDRTLRQIN